MERNVGGLLIYKRDHLTRDPASWYRVVDCRVCPFKEWGTLPLTFNIYQAKGQMKIFFLAHGDE